ncbi:MAG: Lipoprotein, putative [Desulfonauticus sp. 38_4375]|jgi:hypothetical protein|nr:MAG: Lipoprotein, putative [Desulfonauticus sp. 38_4375]
MLLIVACSSGPNLKEGKWKISTKVETTGMPFNFSIPASDYVTCLTADNAIPVDEESKDNDNCKILKKSITGDTLEFTIECINSGIKNISEIEVTYMGEEMEGTMKTNYQGMVMTTHLKGKRIGECD